MHINNDVHIVWVLCKDTIGKEKKVKSTLTFSKHTHTRTHRDSDIHMYNFNCEPPPTIEAQIWKHSAEMWWWWTTQMKKKNNNRRCRFTRRRYLIEIWHKWAALTQKNYRINVDNKTKMMNRRLYVDFPSIQYVRHVLLFWSLWAEQYKIYICMYEL